MPLFEYECRRCSRRFEHLARGGESPSCPFCASTELEKQLSVFAVPAGGASKAADFPPSPCGLCGDPRGPGSCSVH